MRDQLCLLMTCRRMYKFIAGLNIQKRVNYEKIRQHSQPQIFRNMLVTSHCNEQQYNYLCELDKLESIKFMYTRRGYSVKLPKSIKHVKYNNSYNEKVNLPEGLLSVSFGSYNKSMILPKSLKSFKIKCTGSFHGRLNLPEGLLVAKFLSAFDSPVKLPSTLQNVEFGYRFNQPVELPDGLVTVKFGVCYDQPVVLPKTIKSVEFGHCFNQHIDLPEGIVEAAFGYGFMQPVIWPKSLQKLQIYDRYLRNPRNLPDYVITTVIQL